jgi:hypothetical protein
MPPVIAFVSWAHSSSGWDAETSQRWRARVLDFTQRLRAAGVDARVDLFHFNDPDVDWTRYGPEEIDRADFVIVALSEAWGERWRGINAPTEGAGAAREADALHGLFNVHQGEFQRKVKLVLLHGVDAAVVPSDLHRLQRFTISDEGTLGLGESDGFDDLVRTLTGQARYLPDSLAPGPADAPIDEAEIERRVRIERIDDELRSIEHALSALPTPLLGQPPNPKLPQWRAWNRLEGDALTLSAEKRGLESQARHARHAEETTVIVVRPTGAHRPEGSLTMALEVKVANDGARAIRGGVLSALVSGVVAATTSPIDVPANGERIVEVMIPRNVVTSLQGSFPAFSGRLDLTFEAEGGIAGHWSDAPSRDASK